MVKNQYFQNWESQLTKLVRLSHYHGWKEHALDHIACILICSKMVTDFLENFQLKNWFCKAKFNSIYLYRGLYRWSHLELSFMYDMVIIDVAYALKLAPKQVTLFRWILLSCYQCSFVNAKCVAPKTYWLCLDFSNSNLYSQT